MKGFDRLSKGVFSLALSLILNICPQAQTTPQDEGDKRARDVIRKAIEALGGQTFLNVKDISSSGKYYVFRKGMSSLPIPFKDYTKLPNKSRYEEGEKKRLTVKVHNLELGKGWVLEGRDLREATPEEMEDFKRTVKHSIENLLRTRWSEPGAKLFYYGPDEISSRTRAEAVGLVDADNDSVTIYFDLYNHRPIKVEYTERDASGQLVRIEQEFSNWHNIQGVMTPLRIDIYADGQTTAQIFIEKLSYNNNLPEAMFDKPEIPKKK